jgi:hypothetical protein
LQSNVAHKMVVQDGMKYKCPDLINYVLVMISTDGIDSCNSYYHTISTAPSTAMVQKHRWQQSVVLRNKLSVKKKLLS